MSSNLHTYVGPFLLVGGHDTPLPDEMTSLAYFAPEVTLGNQRVLLCNQREGSGKLYDQDCPAEVFLPDIEKERAAFLKSVTPVMAYLATKPGVSINLKWGVVNFFL